MNVFQRNAPEKFPKPFHIFSGCAAELADSVVSYLIVKADGYQVWWKMAKEDNRLLDTVVVQTEGFQIPW